MSVGGNIDCKTNCGFSTGDALALGGIAALGGPLLIAGLGGHDVPAPPSHRGRDLTFLPFVTPQTEEVSVLMHW